ncbi:MAG: CBS domain-containing protein [Pseudomonadales bacterium]|nr:CBS domain-containing protein [Pseudomonadales bacterium]
MSEEPPSSQNNEKSWLDRITSAFSASPKDSSDLLEIIQEAHENELLDKEALNIMEGALQVGDKLVKEIMIPRSQMVVVSANARPEEFLPTIIENEHSRYPVVGDSLDEIKGILLAKSLLPLITRGTENFQMSSVLHPANIIPERKRLIDLLQDFRENRYHMAIVVDEYGGISGLVTIEDVLEEIVGDIEDETDFDEIDNNIRHIKANDYLVKALTPLEDFNEEFNAGFDETECDTIGGVLMRHFGHLPKRNEVSMINGFRFKVVNADNRQIHLLRITAPESKRHTRTE